MDNELLHGCDPISQVLSFSDSPSLTLLANHSALLLMVGTVASAGFLLRKSPPLFRSLDTLSSVSSAVCWLVCFCLFHFLEEKGLAVTGLHLPPHLTEVQQ